MDRLEAVEVSYSYIKESDVFRLDSFFYAKKFLREESTIRSISNNTLQGIGVDLKSFGAYSLNNEVEYLNSGIPFIRGTNMKDGDIDFTNMIYISEKAHKLLWKSEVKCENILLSMSGTIGDVAIALPTWNYPINSNQDIVKINTNKKIDPYFLYIFLLSDYGQNYLKREARGSVQQHVFLSQIEHFRIPLFSSTFCTMIRSVVLKNHSAKSEAQSLYAAAEDLLLSELGLKNYTPANKSVSIKSFANSFGESGRLDAEYYQPKYEKIIQTIQSYRYGFSYIKDFFTPNKQIYKFNKSEHLYIEIGDVDVSSGTATYNTVLNDDLPANAKIKLNKGDLIYSTVRPYRGAVAICDFDDDVVVSGAFTVLHEKSHYLKECLFILLRSNVYQEYIMKFNVGSSYPVVRDDDVLNLNVPLLPIPIQQQIAEKVQRSFTLRQKSTELLEQAKQAVEMAIEQGEDVAIKWLEEIM